MVVLRIIFGLFKKKQVYIKNFNKLYSVILARTTDDVRSNFNNTIDLSNTGLKNLGILMGNFIYDN